MLEYNSTRYLKLKIRSYDLANIWAKISWRYLRSLKNFTNEKKRRQTTKRQSWFNFKIIIISQYYLGMIIGSRTSWIKTQHSQPIQLLLLFICYRLLLLLLLSSIVIVVFMFCLLWSVSIIIIYYSWIMLEIVRSVDKLYKVWTKK